MRMKSNHPELLRLDDPGYRAWQAECTRRHRAISGGPTRPPPLQSTLGHILERGTRSLLGEHRTLSDRRILYHYEQRLSHRSGPRYKEIDAVAMDEAAENPVCFFEVKSSVHPAQALRNGLKQLRALRRIIHAARWAEEVRMAAILVVPTAAELHQDPADARYHAVEELGALASGLWSPDRPAVLFMRRDLPWQRALERGWVEDPELLEQVRHLEAGHEPEPRAYSTGDDPGDSSLASALRGMLRRD